MIQNNNVSVLPWYLNEELQDNKRTYAYGDIYPLFSPANRVLPFQIIRPSRSGGVARVTLVNKARMDRYDITSKMSSTGLRVVKFSGYDVIVYPGGRTMNLGMDEGRYSLELSDGTDTWYSDIFTSVYGSECYLTVEWYDDEDLVFAGGRVVYTNPEFRNILYLNTQLCRPDYEYEEEGSKRDGLFFAEKQLSWKTYKCTTLAPEYLCDVMRLIRLADHVRITDGYGRVYDCDSFLCTPKWEAQGNLASMDIEFTTDTIVKKLAKGYVLSVKGDYNDDYNDDYNNK